MANETKRIIEIEAKYQTLAELQRIVERNKAAIEDLDRSSAEYQKGLAELKGVQREYQQEMRIAVKETTSAKGSYNDLVNQLARLKEMWKQADPKSDAYEQYTREVNKVKVQLEEMDHSIGNYQRNVGNYGNSIRSVAHLFGGAGSAAAGAVTGVKNLTAGFKALSATPVIGVLTILVSILSKVVSSLKQSEAASMRMAEALAPLKAGGDLLKIAMEGVANAIAGVAEWLGKMADKLGLVTDRMKETQAITKEQNDLRKREREILIENARLELEVAQQRNVAADKARVSVQDRIIALEKAEAAEKRILANELEIAQKKFDLAKREAALAPNDAATNDALAQAEANLYRVQASYEQGMRRIIAAHSEALKEMGRATTEAVTEGEATVTEASTVTADAVSQHLLNAANAYEKGTRENLQKMVTLRRYQLRTLQRAEDESEEQFRARQLEAQKAYTEAKRALKEREAQESLDALKYEYLQSEQTTQQHLQYQKELAEANLASTIELGRKSGESEIAYMVRVEEARRKLAEAEAAIEAEDIARRKKYLEDHKKQEEERRKNAVALANSLASILDSMAGAYQNEIKTEVEAGRMSEAEGERQFENVKALQIAVSTIQMLTGITTALAGTFTTKTGPWDIALAAAQAASIAASGVANISKIANTTLGSAQKSSAVGAGVQSVPSVQTTAPVLQVAVPEYRTITSAQDERTINERTTSQKVVLVTSELEAYNAGRKVTLAESTF